MRLTIAETGAIAEGYQRRLDEQSDNFRRLHELIYNANFKPKRTAEQLWPLRGDKVESVKMTEAEMYERNRAIIENYNKLKGNINVN